MDGYVKMIVGYVVFIPLIVLIFVSSWKYWQGKWLRTIGGWTFAPDEGPESLYQKRRARRIALGNLVLAALATGTLVSVTLEATGVGPRTSMLSWGLALSAVLVGSAAWILATGRRDGKAVAQAAAGTGPGLVENYELDTTRAVVLVLAMAAVMAVEIGGGFVAPW